VDLEEDRVDPSTRRSPGEERHQLPITRGVVSTTARTLHAVRAVEAHRHAEGPDAGKPTHVDHEVTVPEGRPALGDDDAVAAAAPHLVDHRSDLPWREELALLHVHGDTRAPTGHEEVRLSAEECRHLQEVHHRRHGLHLLDGVDIRRDRNAEGLPDLSENGQSGLQPRATVAVEARPVGLVEARLEDDGQGETLADATQLLGDREDALPLFEHTRPGDERQWMLAADPHPGDGSSPDPDSGDGCSHAGSLPHAPTPRSRRQDTTARPMHRDHHTRQRTIAAAADAVVLSALWVGLTGLRSLAPAVELPAGLLLQTVDFSWHAPLAALVVPLWLLALARHDGWRPSRGSGQGRLASLCRGALIATLLLLGGLFAAQRTDQLSRTLVFGHAVLAVPALAAVRGLQAVLRRRGWLRLEPWQILAVGHPGTATGLADALTRQQDPGVQLVGMLTSEGSPTGSEPPILGRMADLPAVLAQRPIDQVFLTGPDWPVETLRDVADACEEQGVRLSLDANFLGLQTARAHLDDVEGQTILSFSSTPVDADALLVKRALDVVLSATLLVLLAPVLLLTATAVRLSDGGPALFSQVRSGLHGRPFRMLKFRSMVVDAEARRAALDDLNERDGPVFKLAADPRITPLARFLRRSSLDELPQLWNVLVGEMSLVGPRPPIPSEVMKYARWQRRRLSMKPGITCTWQVSGRGDDVDFDQWMRQDLAYIDNWSLTLDLSLLVRTIPVVLRGRGAQ